MRTGMGVLAAIASTIFAACERSPAAPRPVANNPSAPDGSPAPNAPPAPPACVPTDLSALVDGPLTGCAVCREDGWCWANAPVGSSLSAIWARSDDDVWAVGEFALHFDGSSWTTTLLPEGVGPLSSIWGSSATDVWATSMNALLHWDGRAWSVVPVPTRPEGLLTVSGTGPADVWVGAYSAGKGKLLHWNGTTWTETRLDWPPSLLFALEPGHAIAASGGRDCQRYSQGAWSPDDCGSVPHPLSIWGSAADDVWIFGGVASEAPGGTHFYRAHWDGKAWSREELDAAREYTRLFGTGKDDVWLGPFHFDGTRWTLTGTPGSYIPLSGARGGKLWSIVPDKVLSSADGAAWTRELTLQPGETAGLGAIGGRGFWTARSNGKVLRSDGRSWQSIAPAAGLRLSAAFGSAESDVWGVQMDDAAFQLHHWDGASWSAVEAPAPALSWLGPGWSNGPSDAWLLSGDGQGTRLFHWDGLAWSRQAEVADAILYSLWGGAPGDLWVAGHRVSEGRRRALVRHWDGTAWRTAYEGPDFALLDNGGYSRVTGSGPGEVWVIRMDPNSGTPPDQLLRWNGLAFENVIATGWNAVVAASGPDDVWLLGGSVQALRFDGRSWTASAPLQLTSGPGGPLQTGVRGFGAVYMGFEGTVYVNRR